MCTGKCTVSNVALERGCLVTAVIIAIASALSLLASVVKIVLTTAQIVELMFILEYMNDKPLSVNFEFYNVLGFIPYFFYTVMAVVSSMIFGFSVMLCYGIRKRKAGQVMTYFIFGVTLTVVLMTAAITSFFGTHFQLPGIFTVLACGVYSVFLVFVRLLYSRFVEDESTKKNQVHLVEG